MAVVKVIELVGTSTESWEDAVQQVVGEASQSLRRITGVDVVNQTAHVDNGRISEYRATVNVAFMLEHHSQVVGGATGHPEFVGADDQT